MNQFPLAVGDRVEDRRVKKVWPKPGDTERYEGVYGTVTKTTESAFRVQWDDGHEMGYGWGFYCTVLLDDKPWQGIIKHEGVRCMSRKGNGPSRMGLLHVELAGPGHPGDVLLSVL